MNHISVMTKEVVEALSPKDGGFYIDGTFGGGGHSAAILDAENCKLMACDRDPMVSSVADDFALRYPGRFEFRNAMFSSIPNLIHGDRLVDGIILDLGISSDQLEDGSRGFSFRIDAPLDMDMGLSVGRPLLGTINRAPVEYLSKCLKEYGDVHSHDDAAIAIDRYRKKQSITRTSHLVEALSEVSKSGRFMSCVFQALRRYQNKEPEELLAFLKNVGPMIKHGGSVVILSFQSQEAYAIKRVLKSHINKSIPFSPSGEWKITKKTVSRDEIRKNKRSSSACLWRAEMCVMSDHAL